ncbi:hypothetical protein Tco_1263107 [Tanacetum coccineum]
MNQEEIRQVTSRDEKWVSTKERVKISTTNVRLETTVPQKEETFQFWYIVKKVTGTNSYEFHLANKKCLVDAEVFRKILDICPRVQGVDFTEVLDDESTLTFLIDLGYKVSFWENVDYPELIWEDFVFQIDQKMEKQRRHEIMSYPRLKFVRIGEDFQEYGLPILETMLTKKIKQLEFYKMFIKYSTGLIPPKKSIGSRRVIKKKVTIFADDNIIPKPDVSLEVGKSMSLIEAAKEKATRQVHATHERFVTESDPEPARRRPSEKLAADKMQALKASRKSIRSQPHAGVSSKGTGTKPRVLDELKITPITSSEGTEDQGDDENIPWESTDEDEEKKDDDDDADDDKSIDLEKTDYEETNDKFMHSEEYVQDNDEETNDELVHSDEQVNDDVDEEMINAKDADTGNDDEEIIDAAKADAEKTEEAKDDIKKAEFLQQAPSYRNLQGFGNQFLNLSFDTSLIGTVKDTTVAEINSLLDVQIQQEIPHIKSPSVLTVSVSVISEPLVLISIPQTPLVAPATTLLPPPTISSISHLNEVDHTTTLCASLRSEIPSAVNAYLGSNLGDALQKPWFNNMVSAAKNPLTFDKLIATPIDFSKYAMNQLKIDNLTQGHLVGPVYKLLKGTCTSSIELEYNIEECFKALIDKLDRNNPKGDRCPFDLTKPLPLKGRPGRLTVVAEYFFNNDLEVLKSLDLEKRYTTSITKTKATRYEIGGIEDTVPTLCSTTKVGYNKDVEKGIKHWGDKRQLWYRSQLNKLSKHIVYSTQNKRQHWYRSQLLQLDGSDIVGFIVALHMFTRSLIIKIRVEDLQLGVESYQKKLNITKPQKTYPGIEFKELYTQSFDPPWIIYEDLNKQKRVMRADELYKRLGLMVELINKKMLEMRIIRNLERMVGAWELEMDYRLMTPILTWEPNNTFKDEHSDGEIVPESLFEDGELENNHVDGIFSKKEKEVSEDPFNLYSLLKRQNKLDDKDTNSEDSLKHPPGFTPLTHNCENDTSEKKVVFWVPHQRHISITPTPLL